MKLNYRKLGQGSPFFILHGLCGLSDNWATVGKMLAAHGSTQLTTSFEVYLIDLRNHGSSPHSDEWSYPAMANDVKELMDDVRRTMDYGKDTSTINHLPSSILLGHSLGGKIAMQFACLYPELLEKLIVVDMAPKDYPENQFAFLKKLLSINLAEIKTRKEAEVELRKIINDNATIQLLLKNIQWTPLSTSPLTPLHKERGIEQPQILSWKFNLKVIAANQDAIGKTCSIKNKIEIPTLFIRGEKSNYILDSDIPEIKNIFPNSEVKTITDAGHWIHADKPGEFVKCLLEFIFE
jgi:esterase